MKIRITKPCRVNVLCGEVVVTNQEAERLFLLGLAEIDSEKETRTEAKEKKTRKTK